MQSIMLCTVLLFSFMIPSSFAQAADKAPEMTAEQMQTMLQLSQPGENHKYLDALVGKWQHTVTWRMDAKSAPQTMQGSSENRWIMGGRFLQQEAHGEAMGNQPAFEGLGMTGYDNVKKEYTSVWLDNMGTGMMMATAQFDAKKKTFNESGTYACPITGDQHKAFRAAWKIINKNKYTYEMYTQDADGKEFKNMEIVYKRAK